MRERRGRSRRRSSDDSGGFCGYLEREGLVKDEGLCEDCRQDALMRIRARNNAGGRRLSELGFSRKGSGDWRASFFAPRP